MASAGSYIGLLMRSRTQAHIFHLDTSSFAMHKALEQYYTGIVPLVDKYAETYMGKYGKINKLNGVNNSINRNKGSNILGYFMTLRTKIQAMDLPKDSALKNIEDEIMSLIDSTVYMLRNLK